MRKEFWSRKEFWNWQMRRLLKGGMRKISGLSVADFTDQVEPLKSDFLNACGQRDMIIVPQSAVSITAKMPLVTVKGKKGYCFINPWDIIQAVRVPRGFYLALDVEDGTKMLGIAPDDCVEKFEKTSRLGLIANEGAMLAYYWPETLLHHSVDLPGSRLGAVKVAIVWLSGGRPELYWDDSDYSHSQWGSASCGSRVGARALKT